MKKLVSFFLAALLICSAAAASAQTFVTLNQLQRYLEKVSPARSMDAGTHYLEIDGTVDSITWSGASNHYDMILLVDEKQAYTPIGADSPRLCVHFRLHKDEPPFQPGDEITVFGSLNELYSSVMVPCILAKTINGSEDF